jgi:hypothetical protein
MKNMATAVRIIKRSGLLAHFCLQPDTEVAVLSCFGLHLRSQVFRYGDQDIWSLAKFLGIFGK